MFISKCTQFVIQLYLKIKASIFPKIFCYSVTISSISVVYKYIIIHTHQVFKGNLQFFLTLDFLYIHVYIFNHFPNTKSVYQYTFIIYVNNQLLALV